MWGWGAVPAIDWFIASWLHTQLFAHSVKLDPGTFPIFSLPAGTMVSVFSRGRYRDSGSSVLLLAGVGSPASPPQSSNSPDHPWLSDFPSILWVTAVPSPVRSGPQPGGQCLLLVPAIPTFLKRFLYCDWPVPPYFNPSTVSNAFQWTLRVRITA